MTKDLPSVALEMLSLYDTGEPGVIRDAGPLFEANEVFEWIKRVHAPASADLARRRLVALKQSWGLDPTDEALVDPGRGPELHRDGDLVLDAAPHIPRGDETFESWVERARETLGGSFGMQAPGLECASFGALHRLQSLLAPVLAITGPRSFRYNAFLGDYRRTPFGFHVDPHQECVFQYVLSGTRRGLFWNGLVLPESEASWLEKSDPSYAPGRPPETTIDLEPGDIVFWPSTHVHGFEADGPTLALSMVVDRPALRSRREVIIDLELRTLGGKSALPPVDETITVEMSDRIELGIRPGVAYERHDDQLIVGVCGRTFDWPDPASTWTAMQLFDFLRHARGPLTVGELVETFANPSLGAQDLQAVLSMLAGMGLFRFVNTQDS